MTLFRKTSKIAAALMLAVTALTAQAAPVSVSITGFTLTPGAGYGTDADEKNGPDLLGATFSTGAFTTQNFSLNTVGETYQFQVGAVTLTEPTPHGGITATELDGLGVLAKFRFSSPFAALVEVVAQGTATTGPVNDDHTDLIIAWDAVQVAFGNSGLLEIDLVDLDLKGFDAYDMMATVKLLRMDQDVQTGPPAIPDVGDTPPEASTVPEPASLALIGVALAGMGAARRRVR